MEKNNLKCEFSKRLNLLCEENGIQIHGRQTQLGKIFRVSQEAARKWLDCESVPTYERAIQICEHFSVNFEWLMRGVGKKYANQHNELTQNNHTVREPTKAYAPVHFPQTIPLAGRVPLISLAEAGNWSNKVEKASDTYVKTTIEAGPNTFAVKVETNDMEPRFPVGVTIIVDPDDLPKNGSYIIAQQKGASPTFKQLIIDGHKRYLNPLNTRYQAVEFLPDDVICGVVKQMIMDV